MDQFFDNPPLDHNGSVIPLNDFNSVSDAALLSWRDHLCDSFTPGSKTTRPFVFRRLDGSRPELTMLDMGSKEKVRISSSGTAAIKSKSTPGKRRKSTKRKGKKKEEDYSPTLSSEEEAEEEENEGENDAVSTPPPRNRLPRAAKKTASEAERTPSVMGKRKAVMEVAITAKYHGDGSRKVLKTLDQPGTRRLPGSIEQLNKKAQGKEKEPLTDFAGTKSFYLQRRSMVKSTLPEDWRRTGYNAKKVS